MIATSALIREYWPERPVGENKLALDMGVMNVVLPFLGGMPLCQGAGGLAGQYLFGARTGGTNILEGLLEIGLELFLAGCIAPLFASFPTAVISFLLARFVQRPLRLCAAFGTRRCFSNANRNAASGTS